MPTTLHGVRIADSNLRVPPQVGGRTSTGTSTGTSTLPIPIPIPIPLPTGGSCARANAPAVHSSSSRASDIAATTNRPVLLKGPEGPAGSGPNRTTINSSCTAAAATGGFAAYLHTTHTLPPPSASATASASASAFAPASLNIASTTPASAHTADSPASLINSTASLTQSPSPQPATPPDLSFQRPVWGASATFTTAAPAAAAAPSRPIPIATLHARKPPSPADRNDYAISDLDLADCDPSGIMSGALDIGPVARSRQNSFVSAGPKPISMGNQRRESVSRNRRESLAGSLMAGMSWGGMSFGSFVRDDIMMQGTSPSAFAPQSSSFHSSSYMPKLEANFMRDFTCCELILPNLHDLLQHYEEAHHTPTSPTAPRNTAFSHFGRRRASATNNAPGTRLTTTTGPTDTQASNRAPRTQPVPQLPGAPDAMSATAQMCSALAGTMADDMDAVADMELDDAVATMELDDSSKMHQTRQLFGQQHRPQLNMNTSGLTQGLRTSQPPTPAAASFGFQNNPTVSSVNTPVLTTQQQMPSTNRIGDLGGVDEDLPAMPMGGATNALDLGDAHFTNGNDDANFCINDPGKHLFSPTGAFPPGNRTVQQKLAALGIRQGQLADPEANKGLLERLQSIMMPEEHKPFKCPVIGCEKAYKNQNGLKYHKAHGHQTQQLHENGDGTFSIVNPETSAPYPGTLGMEKEKPFNCETCGKRYKNLNGLKYHKSHSLPCNPEFKLQAIAAGLSLPGLMTEDHAMQT